MTTDQAELPGEIEGFGFFVSGFGGRSQVRSIYPERGLGMLPQGRLHAVSHKISGTHSITR